MLFGPGVSAFYRLRDGIGRFVECFSIVTSRAKAVAASSAELSRTARIQVTAAQLVAVTAFELQCAENATEGIPNNRRYRGKHH